MTDVPLPAHGSKDYPGQYAWYTEQEEMSDAAREIVSGRLTDASLKDDLVPGIYAKWHGVTADGVTDDTAAMQAAINAAIAADQPLILPPGTISTGPLDANGTGHAEPADSQWAGLQAMYGAGRGVTILKARTGAYTAGQYVLSHRNVAGCTMRGFTIDGNSGVADCGGNFSWTGGSSGNPALAPSNHNIYEDILVQGCDVLSINFDQQHDSKLSGISVRGSADVGISCNSPGGLILMDTVIVSDGTFNLACQNAQMSGCAFFDGVVLQGAGYNAINWGASHIYPNGTTGVSIDSQATGNASRGSVFIAAFFPPTTTVVRGRFHQGVEFIGCNFSTYTNFFGTITPAGGTGALPVFYLRGCSLGGAIPSDVASQVQIRLEHCRDSAGSIIDRHAWMSYTPTWNAGGSAVTLGNGSLTGRQVRRGSEIAVRVYLLIGSTTSIPAGTWTFALPATALSGKQVGSVWFLDSGTRHYVGVAKVDGGSASAQIIHSEAGGAGLVDNANPFAWTTGDELAFEITYEV